MKRWRRTLGIRVRMALLYLGIFTTGLVFFCFLLFQYFHRTQVQAFDTTLYNFAVDISGNLQMDFIGRLFVLNASVGEEGKVFPFHLGRSFLEIRDPSGKILLHSKSLKGRELPFDPGDVQTLPEKKAVFRTIQLGGDGPGGSHDLRLLTYWAYHSDWLRPLILQIAVPLDLPYQERRNLLLFFFTGIPVFLLITVIAGIFMSQRALKPVKDMTMKARHMGAGGKLSDRIPVPPTDDEIRELALTFNGLLNRLERAFNSQERFISNASHQLKTPLTILKGELNLLNKRSPVIEDLREFAMSASSEIDHMIKLVEDLLLLARLEAGEDTLAVEPVALDEVLLNVVSRIQRLAEPRDIKIKTMFGAESAGGELDVEILGDEDLISCLLENLVENAVKYSPNGTEVRVMLYSTNRDIQIVVSDEGPGISSENKRKIFERFHRNHPSSFVAGSGLGLAIASEIAHLHAGQIEVDGNDDGRPGAKFTVTFRKKVPSPAPSPSVDA